MIEFQKITVVRLRKPVRKNINDELQWLGNSLGLFSLRDKDKSMFRIFIELLKSAKRSTGLTSDELAIRLNLSRGTVCHHLKKLRGSGIVVVENKRYILRVDNLRALIEELERDTKRMFDDLRDIAKDIDMKLGLL